MLTGGLQALASQRLHPPAPSLLASSVCDLRTTSPIKPCADTCPSPEVREAPSGVGKRECGVSPALGLQTAVSVALVTCGSSGELAGPGPCGAGNQFCALSISARTGPALLGGVAQPRARARTQVWT